MALWIRSENHSTSPLVDMKMMRIPEVWTTNLCALLFGFGMYVMFTIVPQFVETPTATTTDSARRSPNPDSICCPSPPPCS